MAKFLNCGIYNNVMNVLIEHSVMSKYTLINRIGKGSFGEVYKAYRTANFTVVAIKIGRDEGRILLEREFKIYREIISNGCRIGIPKIFELIQTDEYNMMVMEMLGQSLEDLFVDAQKKFNLGTVLCLGVSVLNIIENIHNAGFIHRDIKTNNFLVGLRNRHKIYLTDYGLSKKYIDKDNKHITESFGHNIIGTARYSSINMHLGITPSRRDDLESIGYMLIYFGTGSLPWQGIKWNKNKKNMFDGIRKIKLSTSVELLCYGLPDCFMRYIEYCRNLRFDEKPDYAYLKQLFIETSTNNGIRMAYEWDIKIEKKIFKD